MLPEKTNISARVEITLKKIVEESNFTHKDAYELGAMLIAIGDAEDTITLIHNNPNYQKTIKQTQYRLIEARKQELERELRDLKENHHYESSKFRHTLFSRAARTGNHQLLQEGNEQQGNPGTAKNKI